MYSKNDYRYYLEHRLEESDDYLAHYGVKGMKWKHHLKRAANSIGEFFHPKPTITFDSPTVYSNNELVRAAQKSANKAKYAENDKKRRKKKLAPKNQKITVITSPKRKRSKKEAKWNKEMQGYGKEILASQNKKRR